MLEHSQLPFLVQLLEDETPSVRENVLDALAAFGPDLDTLLSELPEPPDPVTIRYINGLVAQHLWNRPLLLPAGGESEPADNENPRFRPGQIVRHKRYGYRGVVVELDPICRADETWYTANRSQPERNQPWYHVLVHESMQVTYAAETSLECDESGEEVVHPYVPYFFTEFKQGEYIRNSQPWPS
ncbi:MAG: heat shock protein HspQ [Nitrospirota bacterium]|nr:heat shock protein HspQ [Nitrospirota bacterium]